MEERRRDRLNLEEEYLSSRIGDALAEEQVEQELRSERSGRGPSSDAFMARRVNRFRSALSQAQERN